MITRSFISLIFFLLLIFGTVMQTLGEELSVDNVLEESNAKQLCGEFVTEDGIYEKFVFGDKGIVNMFAAGMEFPYRYFISENIAHIKTDKAFLEFQIENFALIHGKDAFTEGHTYRREKAPQQSCLPMERAQLENLICFTNGIQLQGAGNLTGAADKYLECCDSGHAESCNHCGLLKTILQDELTGMKYYKKSCDMGFGGGCSNIAYLEKRKGNLRKAGELLDEACRKGFQRGCMEAIELREGSPEIYRDRGLSNLQDGKYDSAIADFTAAIELKPEYAEAYRLRGIAYETRREYNHAVADLSRVIEFLPNDSDAYRMRGINYLYQGKYKEAAADFRRAIRSNSDDEYLHLYLVNASSKVSKNRHEQAIDYLEANLARKQALDEWISLISRYYLGKDGITEKEVLEEARKGDNAVTVNEKHCEAYYFIAEEKLRQGKQAEAIEYFNKSIATEVTQFREYWLSVNILRQMGE